jgi:hypothetical protein
MPRKISKRRTSAEIQTILGDHQASGLSRRDFAARRGIPLPTLHSWIRKHRSPVDHDDLPAVIPIGTFLPHTATIEIELPGGEILRLSPGCRSEDLRCALEALRQC